MRKKNISIKKERMAMKVTVKMRINPCDFFILEY